jgi:hypothetical protein
MAETIEEAMKRLYTFFAKCDPSEGNADKVIVPKKQLRHLVDDLNTAVMNAAEAFEQTQLSRERALRALETEKEERGANIKQQIEDMMAGALLYTNEVMTDLELIVLDAQKKLHADYVALAEQLEAKIQTLRSNKDQLKHEFTDLGQTEKYNKIIEDFNKNTERELEALLGEDDRNLFDFPVSDEFSSSMYDRLTTKIKSADAADDTDDFDDGSRISYDEIDDEVALPSFEVHVNPNYGRASVFSSKQLDAEFEQFRNEEEQSDADTDTESEPDSGKNESKGKKSFFRKR